MKILLIQLRRIGDILLCAPAIRYLRQVFPDGKIDFLCEKMGLSVLETHPDLNRVTIYDKEYPIRQIRNVRREKYDAVIDLMGNPRTSHLTALSGARYRVGYKRFGRSLLYNVAVSPPKERLYVPKTKLYLLQKWMEKAGFPFVEPDQIRPTLSLTEDDRRFAGDWMQKEKLSSGSYFVIAPAHRHAIRQWREEGFRDVALRIRRETPYRVFLAWGPGEEEMMKRIRSGVEAEIDILPKTALRQMGAIFKNARALITNDSGPMHIAVAVGTPTVTIYGPTLPVDWNPSVTDPIGSGRDTVLQSPEVACLGCHLGRCPHGHLCMTHLSSRTVFRAVQRHLQLEER